MIDSFLAYLELESLTDIPTMLIKLLVGTSLFLVAMITIGVGMTTSSRNLLKGASSFLIMIIILLVFSL